MNTFPLLILFFFTSVPKNETCVHKKKNVTVNIDGCISAGAVESTMCEGSCASNAMTVLAAPYMKTDCKCCKPTKLSRVQVPLTCGTSGLIYLPISVRIHNDKNTT